jgi:hypothetical protein
MDYQEEYNQMMKKGKIEGVKGQERFRYIIIAVVAFVLGFGLAWVSFKGQEEKVIVDNTDINQDKVQEVIANVLTDIEVDPTTGEESSEVVSIGNVSLSVEDQAPAKSVFVKEVSAEKPVWVVIVEDNSGQRGNIIGAGLFDIGETAGLVELLRGTVEGGSYYAVLYNEDSDLIEDRTYDLDKDLPLVDGKGSSIEVLFKTSSIPE